VKAEKAVTTVKAGRAEKIEKAGRFGKAGKIRRAGKNGGDIGYCRKLSIREKNCHFVSCF